MQTLNNEQPNSFFGFVGLKTTNLYTLFLCANHCQIFFFFVVYLLKDNNKNLFKQQLTYGIVPQFNYVTWYSWTRNELQESISTQTIHNSSICNIILCKNRKIDMLCSCLNIALLVLITSRINRWHHWVGKAIFLQLTAKTH